MKRTIILTLLPSLFLVAAAHAQTVIYYHTDALGTPIAVTDASGNVVERSEYEPYGSLLNRPLTDGPGYTGHVMDAATGLTYMQQRYYDAGIGKFLSVDPISIDGNSGGNFNRYKYASNNPYRFVDLDGRKEYDCRTRGCTKRIMIKDLRPGDVVRTKGAVVSMTKDGDVKVSLNEGWESGASAAASGPNIVPKIPPGVNLESNINSASKMSLGGFYQAVRNKGIWDYKQDKSDDYAPFGNFNYGATGSALGLSNRTLLEGAGYASMKASERHSKSWGIPLVGFRSRGDDPVDQYWIQQGVRYFNEGLNNGD